MLEPNKDYAIRGFYNKGKVFDFVAKADANVSVAELGENADRHGKFDFDIFVEPISVTAEASVPKTRKPEFSFRTVNCGGR